MYNRKNKIFDHGSYKIREYYNHDSEKLMAYVQ